MMPSRVAAAAAVLAMLAGPAGAAAAQGTRDADVELVTLRTPASPLVSIRTMFRAGSIHDPEGKEGLSALTALMIGSSGTAKRSYSELLEALYPMAAEIGVITDREVVVFSGQVHRETLDDYATLFAEALLAPGFRQEDLERNRDQLLAFLTTTLRSANDELLGLELIQQVIFRDHPYGHAPAGTVEGLKSITLDDVRRFYQEHYTRANLILGIGGGYPDQFPKSFTAQLSALPRGRGAKLLLPPPQPIEGRRFTVVDKQAQATGIHFGYAIPITRTDPEFYALMVANSFLGEHRTFHGRLMQELRGKRGLNYGDYSYIEYWDNAPGTSNPPPNHPRRQQYFSVWVRPVGFINAPFAVRAAIHEVHRLIAGGMTQEEFVLTRDFLISYSKLWARSLSDRLGFHMDSRFYGMPYFIDHMQNRLAALTVEDVNRATRKYLQTDDFSAVIITGQGKELARRLAEPSAPIAYENPVPADVTEADKKIVVLPLDPAAIRIVPIENTFTGAWWPKTERK